MYFLPCVLMALTNHIKAHRAGRSCHRLHRRLQRIAVEIRHLQLGDVLHLLHRHRADLVLVRHRGADRDVGGLLEQHGRRRRLGDERVRTVGINRHDRGNDQPLVFRRLRVEGLDEVHDVDAVRAERGADRRRRRGLAGGNLELHHRLNFFRHYSFSTCRKSSSTGVARPKIVTITLSVFFSMFTSSTMPLKPVNGPSLMRTWSPLSKVYFGFGFSAAVLTCSRICSTSSLLSGVGLAPAPTNPVTFGVFLTTCHALSVMFISTRM